MFSGGNKLAADLEADEGNWGDDADLMLDDGESSCYDPSQSTILYSIYLMCTIYVYVSYTYIHMYVCTMYYSVRTYVCTIIVLYVLMCVPLLYCTYICVYHVL